MRTPRAPEPAVEALAEPLAARTHKVRERSGLAEIARAGTCGEPPAAEPA